MSGCTGEYDNWRYEINVNTNIAFVIQFYNERNKRFFCPKIEELMRFWFAVNR